MRTAEAYSAELTEMLCVRPELWGFLRHEVLDGFWFGDVYDETDRYVSPEFWQMLGYGPAETADEGVSVESVIFSEDLELARQNLHRHATHPEHPFDVTLRYRHITGETVWARCNGMVVQDPEVDGKPRLFAVHRDVSPLRGRRVSNSNRFLSLIMNATQSAIVGLSASGDVLAINAFGRHVLGGYFGPVPFAWPEKITFVDGTDMSPMEASRSPVNRALSGATIRGELAAMTRRKGEVRYVKVSSAPVKAPYTPLSAVLIMDDVTEQEKQRQQMERSSRLDALGQLTGGIAHDFNNLLATIQYAVELAKEEDDPTQRANYLGTVQSSVARGAEMTRRLLTFAKRQIGIEKPQDVRSIFAEFQQMAVPLIEADIALRFSPMEEPTWVFCDGGQLENALLNLVLNSRDAIRSTGQGRQIHIAARLVGDPYADEASHRLDLPAHIALAMEPAERLHAGQTDDMGYVEFSVTDDGPGMPIEVQRRAVDPFFSTKSASTGTGLGLSMVYGFLQQAGGEMTLYSAPGKGTSVRMLMPRVAGPDAKTGVDIDPISAQGAGERVLIVEDEAHLLDLMQDLVSSMGYAVDTAPSGLMALKRIGSGERVDLLLTDVVMPGGVGGFELARRVRAEYPELPILYMSGYTGFSKTEMGDVVAPILPKPCPPGRLAIELRRALQGG